MTPLTRTFPEKLYSCWHPVGYSHEIGDTPYGTFLLDQAVVIWRSVDGMAHAMRDLCVHRGTALSLGWIRENCLVCPYHAWEYDQNGACVHIPQAPDAEIPKKARTPVYHCQEKFGLVWVAIKDPIYALPDIPEYKDDEWKWVNTGPFEWKSDASRQVENFTDFGHFPWVHPGLLGDPERPLVPDYNVEIKEGVLYYSIVRPEASNSEDYPVFANDDVIRPERRSLYRLYLPYTIVLRLGWGGEEGMIYFFVSQPVSANKCRGYCVIGRNYDLGDPDTILQDFEQVIFDQDKRIVESQRPEQVPFDFTEELHLKFDAVAMNYRRAMKKEGLAN
ncbi:aromatic ring-hydroxylating dioxygenase subunit alpha [Flavobacteriaceae bacterium TP-CH-4]|uniref:Aromatic ring-hydroxylating dioxygenase subunit alpha n=1 Tax=Pelagihabitans pacificus TaxID=2696054 RepID=A0A967AWA4_9FLAO|nr:aromatic ring-hydroxylating dioxygenase subunit alpha [Pelagihabitans pacificus]NHF60545.1 aromatic ring-hydroxylating dioxygenase subunit alpha [Pelagihabitans pacificus]